VLESWWRELALENAKGRRHTFGRLSAGASATKIGPASDLLHLAVGNAEELDVVPEMIAASGSAAVDESGW